MNSEKIDEICKLLKDFNFEWNGDVAEDLKCLNCRRILINACLGQCECQLCRECVDGLVESGCRVCPGNTKFCKESHLSNFTADYRIQRRAARLTVKCPEEMCSYKCELINMSEHMRVCPLSSVKCIFNGFGCDQSNVPAAKMNEHLQLASYSHMEMLLDAFNNMRNEIDQLKENDERNRNEIMTLKRDSLIKEERIKSLEGVIELMKEDKIVNLERKIVTTVAKMDTELSTMRQEWRYQTDLETRMSSAEKWMDRLIDGAFVWTIDNVARRRQNSEYLRNGYFYAKMRAYKIALTVSVNGDCSVAGTGLSAYLFVLSDIRDDKLDWSKPADVTVRIVDRANPDAYRAITNNYTIKRPNDNSNYLLTNIGDFDFLYDDLRDASLLIGDRFIIECVVGVC